MGVFAQQAIIPRQIPLGFYIHHALSYMPVGGLFPAATPAKRRPVSPTGRRFLYSRYRNQQKAVIQRFIIQAVGLSDGTDRGAGVLSDLPQ